MVYIASAIHLSVLSRYILRTMLYYDIFHYPLKSEEIYAFLGCNSYSKSDLQTALEKLVEAGWIHHQKGLYFLGRDDSKIKKRMAGNHKARKMMPIAKRISRLISWFPFVRAVGLSGSISKNYMDRNSDIDFFVMTSPGRLWLARTLLMLFKKIFLFNSRKYFCINYFISTDNLAIDDHNIFTATELVTMIPVYGGQYFSQFYQVNSWVQDYLPNATNYNTRDVRKARSTGLKWLAEKLLSGKIGNWMDSRCMKLTTNVWRKKFTGMRQEEFELALRSRKNVSKHHPQNFQKRVLQCLEDKKQQMEQELGISLSTKS